MRKVLTTSAMVVLLLMGMATTSNASMTTPTFVDWQPCTEEEEQVFKWLQSTGALIGYPDHSFKPWDLVTSTQVIRVCNRVGLSDIDENVVEITPVTMRWVEENFLRGTVKTAEPFEFCTRYRFATMLYRFFNDDGMKVIVPAKAVVDDPLGIKVVALNNWFNTQSWNGKLNRFVGLGHVFVEESERHDIPVSLALCCAWAESCWGAADNPAYNMAFGIRATPAKWGEIRGLVIRGFGDYITMEECVRAYFRYMDGQTNSKGESLYRKYIDSWDWKSIINIYAPSSENDTDAMYRIYKTVKGWCDVRGIE
jgi:hypothetical protein